MVASLGMEAEIDLTGGNFRGDCSVLYDDTGLSATGVCVCENSPNVHLTFMPFILFKFCFKREKKTVMHILVCSVYTKT